jgi:acyl carrier protein
VYEILRTILIDDLFLNENDLRPEAGRKEAGLDSLATVELSMVLSKRFNIVISEDELMEAAMVSDIASLMEQRMPRP